MDKKKSRLLTVKFEATPVTQFEEKKVNGKDFVLWGVDNDYPDFLLGNFEGSPNHNAIVKRKTFYVSGNGFYIESFATEEDRIKAQAFIDNKRGSESLNDILDKIVGDGELYGGWTIENIWGVSSGETAAIEYLDIHNTRKNVEDTAVLYSADWKKAGSRGKTAKNAEVSVIPLFDAEHRVGKQALYFREPAKQAEYYPKPGYLAGNKAISTDTEITNFHYNEIKNGFTGGTMINFANGEPSEEEEKEIEKKLKKKFTGTDGDKLLLTFSNGQDRAPEIVPLMGNDLDTRYESLNLATQQKIFTVHDVTNPMLFGIKTEGQLGGRSELIEALEIFNVGYVQPKQDRILRVFNELLELNGINAKLAIEPISLEQITGSDTDEVVEETKEEAQFTKFKFTAEQGDEVLLEMLSKMGKPKKEVKIYPRKKTEVSSDDEAKALEINLKRSNFANIPGSFDDIDRQILGLIKQDALIQLTEISNAIKEPLDSTVSRVDSMTNSGLINKEGGNLELTNKGFDIADVLEPEEGVMSVVYSYEVRSSEASRGAVISGTRDFCRRLIDLDRVYTRAEINLLNAFTESGDAWRFKGGWWTREGGGVTTKSCRHIWEQHIIIT
jgi:DNA-binding Lrp family transcriptional regulator